MNIEELHAARANLNAALKDEDQALTSACDAVNAGGAKSDQAVTALRSVQAAHARSNAAAFQVRVLSAGLDGADAVPAGPLSARDARPILVR